MARLPEYEIMRSPVHFLKTCVFLITKRAVLYLKVEQLKCTYLDVNNNLSINFSVKLKLRIS